MPKQKFLTSLFVSASLALSGCANMSDGLRTGANNLKDSIQAQLSSRYWYKGSPSYAKHVAPYVIDDERFADFINKYKEPRRLSEQEQLEVIVQLGIYKNKPEWLKPETKAKLDKLSKAQRTKTGMQDNAPILLAANEITTPYGNTVMSDVVPVPIYLSQYLPPVTPVFIAWDAILLTASMTTMTMAYIQLHASATNDINIQLKPEVVQAMKDAKGSFCTMTGFQCQTVTMPPKETNIPSEGNDLKSPGNCTPQEHSRLQMIVNNACGAAYRCDATDNKATLNTKIGQLSSCIGARRGINDKCFNGGDVNHRSQITERINALSRCQRLLSSPKP